MWRKPMSKQHNIGQGSTNGSTIGTNDNANGTIGSPNGTIGSPNGTIGTIGKPMVPYGEMLMQSLTCIAFYRR